MSAAGEGQSVALSVREPQQRNKGIMYGEGKERERKGGEGRGGDGCMYDTRKGSGEWIGGRREC